MKKRLIIPIFIPFGGCPSICVFCDQKGITGNTPPPSTIEVRATIESYLATWKGGGRKEVAFYGGTFTALPLETQEAYLESVREYLTGGLIDGVRVSTRPDCVSDDTASFLKESGVETVELGVQSMNERVLELSGRGHTREDSMRAVDILNKHGMVTGLQIMPGLPGDDYGSIIYTAKEVTGLSPQFVRVYPVLVLKNTPLEAMYQRGEYRPWALDDMVAVCKDISALFKKAGIRIIRMGLHPGDGLRKSVVAGPYHPSFRNLVDSAPDQGHRQRQAEHCKITLEGQSGGSVL
ncbi:MAG: elongator complex protein 3 [Thermodesulfobacteriota bacterium]